MSAATAAIIQFPEVSGTWPLRLDQFVRLAEEPGRPDMTRVVHRDYRGKEWTEVIRCPYDAAAAAVAKACGAAAADLPKPPPPVPPPIFVEVATGRWVRAELVSAVETDSFGQTRILVGAEATLSTRPADEIVADLQESLRPR